MLSRNIIRIGSAVISLFVVALLVGLIGTLFGAKLGNDGTTLAGTLLGIGAAIYVYNNSPKWFNLKKEE